MTTPSLESIEELARRLEFGADWDVVLIGDGAGCDWTKPIGWAATLIDRHDGGRKLFHGAMNAGTIGMAEVLPYVQALLWYANFRGKDVRKQKSPRPVEVHIVTDSAGIADQGNKLATNAKGVAQVRKNYPIWKMLFDFERDGFQLRFHHVERASLALNVLADAQADAAKHAVANAVAIATAQVRSHQPGDLHADSLIHLFNAASGDPTPDGASRSDDNS